jgi:CheY-like chemotaxis protein
MELPRVWLIGDDARPEFAASVAALYKTAEIERFATVAELLATAHDKPSPEVGVVLQKRPGEVSAGDVTDARFRWPLLSLVLIVGDACDGELRSGEPWAADARFSWREAAQRLTRGLADWRRGGVAEWALPRTSTPDDRLLAELARPLSPQRGLVLVDSPVSEFRRWLSDACQSAGWEAAVASGVDLCETRPVCLIWDAPFVGDYTGLPAAIAASPETPILVLDHFYRPDDDQAALAAGAHAILSKPCRLVDLEETIVRLATP